MDEDNDTHAGIDSLIDLVDKVIGGELDDIEDEDDETRAREIRDEIIERLEDMKAILTKNEDAD